MEKASNLIISANSNLYLKLKYESVDLLNILDEKVTCQKSQTSIFKITFSVY